MIRPMLTALLLAVATTGLAQPTITGISPNEGPTAGGTEVTITGSGFTTDASVWVVSKLFEQIRPRAAKVLNSTTIAATMPSHPAGAVSLFVFQHGSGASRYVRFTYVGNDADAIERYLVPVLPPPIAGANGSEFQSVLRFWNAGTRDVAVRGLPFTGVICNECPVYPYTVIGPGTAFEARATTLEGWPTRWIDVANDDGSLAMNLRVYDTSRSARNFGTEIPVVPLTAFRSRIELTAIPIDSRYRLMLRIYGEMEGVAGVTFGNEYHIVSLTSRAPGSMPAYVQIPLSQGTFAQGTAMNLSIVPSPGILASPVLGRIWAFVTVTNNETQHITTITPQPTR